MVLKRCVDLADLLASAATGQAEVAVVSGALSGLDADAVRQLLREDVRCVAVGGRRGDARPHRRGDGRSRPPTSRPWPRRSPPPAHGRWPVDPDAARPEPRTTVRGCARPGVIAVHGPAGAPGRTTLAIGLAAEHAHRRTPERARRRRPARRRGRPAPRRARRGLRPARGGAAGQRRARWTPPSFARCRRVVADGFEVLTGLPRPDRWVEARPGRPRRGPRAGRGGRRRGGRHRLQPRGRRRPRASASRATSSPSTRSRPPTTWSWSAPPSPPGWPGWPATLVELRDSTPSPVTVVVNRMRDSLGWSRRDIVGMVEGYVRPAGVHFLPEDRPTTDRALVAGRSLVELGDSALRTGRWPRCTTRCLGRERAGSERRPSAGRGRSRCRRP